MESLYHCWSCGGLVRGIAPTRCNACGVYHWPNWKIAAGAVILSERREMLLVRRRKEPRPGQWDLPGGFVDAREAPDTALRRELWEELGCHVTATRLLCAVTDKYLHASNPTIAGVVVLYFTASTDPASNLRPDGVEVDAAQFHPIDNLPGNLAFPSQVRDVVSALRSNTYGQVE